MQGLDWRLAVHLFTYCQPNQIGRPSAKCQSTAFTPLSAGPVGARSSACPLRFAGYRCRCGIIPKNMSEKAPELPRARAGRTTEVGQPAVDKIPDATCRPVAASPTGVAYLAIEVRTACASLLLLAKRGFVP